MVFLEGLENFWGQNLRSGDEKAKSIGEAFALDIHAIVLLFSFFKKQFCYCDPWCGVTCFSLLSWLVRLLLWRFVGLDGLHQNYQAGDFPHALPLFGCPKVNGRSVHQLRKAFF